MKKAGKSLQKGKDRKWLAYSKLKTMMRKKGIECQKCGKLRDERQIQGNPYEEKVLGVCRNSVRFDFIFNKAFNILMINTGRCINARAVR